MILRKPYAVFIKNFKLFHVVMSLFMVYSLYCCVSLYNFFRVYSIDYKIATTSFSVGNYLNSFSFISVFIILILTGVLLSVMFYKDKPKVLYIYSAVLYLAVIILYFVSNSSVSDINNSILDIRVTKAYRDFYLIVTLLEFVSLVWTIVRATGFDIKQFDFGTDLQQLDISDEDSEEIEVAVEFDKNKVIRNFNNRLRMIKYVYFEHMFIINVVLGLLFVFLSYNIYSTVSSFNAYYSQGETFTVNNSSMNVKDVYLVDSDPSGAEIVETSGDTARVLVVVRFQIKGNVKDSLNTGVVTLRANGLSYGKDSDLAKELYDIGTPYTSQNLSSEFETYIMVFDVPSTFINKKMVLKINDSRSYIKGKVGARNNYVNLKPIDLRNDDTTVSAKMGETISFEDSVLGVSNLTINNYEVDSKFRLSYKYCVSTDKCLDSSEYVTATATGNYFKTLLKLDGNLSIDKNLNATQVQSLSSFINTFATINYKIGDNWKSIKLNTKQIKPVTAKTKDLFVEVPFEVKNASNINLSFKVRNITYKYVLK